MALGAGTTTDPASDDNLRIMDRRDIEIFLTLADELHFGRTGQRLLVSQARVSQTIAKLERQLGVLLFLRTSRRVQLTATGAVLADEVRAGWYRIEQAVSAARAAGQNVAITLTVSLEAPALADLAADVFGRFTSHQPSTRIVFREAGFADPLDLLRRREVDVAVTNAPIDEPDIEPGPVIYTEDVVLAVARTHPLAAQQIVTLEDMVGHVVLRAGRRAAPYWDGSGQTPSTWQELLAAVAVGEGISPVAAHAAEYFARPTVTMVPFTPGSPSIRWAICWRRGERTASIDALVRAAG